MFGRVFTQKKALDFLVKYKISSLKDKKKEPLLLY